MSTKKRKKDLIPRSNSKYQKQFKEYVRDSVSDIASLVELKENSDDKVVYAIQLKDGSDTEDWKNIERITASKAFLEAKASTLFTNHNERTLYIFENTQDALDIWDDVCTSLGVVVIRDEEDWEEYMKNVKHQRIVELQMQWGEFCAVMSEYPPNLEILDMRYALQWNQLNSLFFLPESIKKVILNIDSLQTMLPLFSQVVPRQIVIFKSKEELLYFSLPKMRTQLYDYNSMLLDSRKTNTVTIYSKEQWDILESFLVQEPTIVNLILDMKTLDFEIINLPVYVKALDLSEIQIYKHPLSLFEKTTRAKNLKHVVLNQHYSFPIQETLTYNGTVCISDKNEEQSIIFNKYNNTFLFELYLKMRENAQKYGTITISTIQEYTNIFLGTPASWWSNVHTLQLKTKIDHQLLQTPFPSNILKIDVSTIEESFLRFYDFLGLLPKTVKEIYFSRDQIHPFPSSYRLRSLTVFIDNDKFVLPQDFQKLQTTVDNTTQSPNIQLRIEDPRSYIYSSILSTQLSNNELMYTRFTFESLCNSISEEKSVKQVPLIPLYLFQMRRKQLMDLTADNRTKKMNDTSNHDENININNKNVTIMDRNKIGTTVNNDNAKIFSALVFDLYGIFEKCSAMEYNIQNVEDIIRIQILPIYFDTTIPWTEDIGIKAKLWINFFLSGDILYFRYRNINLQQLYNGITFVSLLYLFQKGQTVERMEKELAFHQDISYPLPSKIPLAYEQYLESLSLLGRVLCVLQHLFLYWFKLFEEGYSNDELDNSQRLRLIFVPNQPRNKLQLKANAHGNFVFSTLHTPSPLLPKMESIVMTQETRNSFDFKLRKQDMEENLKVFEGISQTQQTQTFQRASNRQRIFMRYILEHTLLKFSDIDHREEMWTRHGDEDIALLYKLYKKNKRKQSQQSQQLQKSNNTQSNDDDNTEQSILKSVRSKIGFYFSFLSYQIMFLLLRSSPSTFPYSFYVFRGMKDIGDRELFQNIAIFLEKETNEYKNLVMISMQNIIQERQSMLFTATSTSFEKALEFADRQNGHGAKVLLKFHIPVSYPFLAMDDSFQDSFQENEMLLPADSRWRIHDIQIVSYGKNYYQKSYLLVDMRIHNENKEEMKTYFAETQLLQHDLIKELNIYLEEWNIEISKDAKVKKQNIVQSLVDRRNAMSYKFFEFFREFVDSSNSLYPITASNFQKYTQNIEKEIHTIKDMDLLFFILYQAKGPMKVTEKWLLQQQTAAFVEHITELEWLEESMEEVFEAIHLSAQKEYNLNPVPCYLALSSQDSKDEKSFHFNSLLDKRVLFFESRKEMDDFCTEVYKYASKLYKTNELWNEFIREKQQSISASNWIVYFCWYWTIEAFVWKEDLKIYVATIIPSEQ